MFTERLNTLLELLGASNTDIAGSAGCDRSLISRLKSGSRIPRPTSNSTEKLINGIFMFADDRNMTGKLIETVSSPTDDPAEIKEHILMYLYEGYKDIKGNKRHTIKNSDMYRSYGAKLGAVIGIADISNVRLAKILHIDASLISRFKKGLRIPKANPKLTSDICDVLFDRILEIGRLDELLKLAGIPESISDDTDECRERFRSWLCDFKTENKSVFVESLLDNISSFSADLRIPLPSPDDAAPDEIANDKRSVYFGTDGIRTAVLRFLNRALKLGADELWLYSDQNMDWMTQDIAYRMKWMSLMRECVTLGIKIRIIHNIDRDLNEMAAAINSWLPLYMSGMIEPYYCKKQGNGKFATTLFLCPGIACISSVHTVGCEDVGIYRYDTDPELLNVHKQYYKKLLSLSNPLIKVSLEELLPEPDGKSVTSVLNTLSLCTMPKALIDKIADRSGLSEAQKHEIISEWEKKHHLFNESIRNGALHECICPAQIGQLTGGKVRIDLRSAELTYTPDEYKEHIKNIIAISERETNYRFYALPDDPFTNISMAVSEKFVAITRLLPPQTTFIFSHPAMCEAFSGYTEHLKEQYKQDKITTRKQLERYI